MKLLKSILKELSQFEVNIIGNQDIDIAGITYNPHEVKNQFVYCCIENEEFLDKPLQPNSLYHWKTAVQNGAHCLIISKSIQIECSTTLTMIQVEDVNRFVGYFAKAFYDNPFENIQVIGITGTNGKTTTSQFINNIFKYAKVTTGVVGSIGCFINSQFDSPSLGLSNPFALDLFQIGHKLVNNHVDNLIMEVTSHAMALDRNHAIDFDIAVFTNLTHDHLDFHKNFTEYKKAKLKFFELLGKATKPAIAITNADEVISQEFISSIPEKRLISNQVKLLSYGIRNKGADIVAYPIDMTGGISKFKVFNKNVYLGDAEISLPGLFNIYNALAAFAIAFALKIKPDIIIAGLKNLYSVPGRFEKADNIKNIDIFIDYAHTPDALENLLINSKKIAKERLICVFGCGGDRDNTKRALMGQISEKLSDISIITSDNPRTEDPLKIIEDITAGITNHSQSVYIEKDRKKAIEIALTIANQNDTIVIAGKGHENYQVIGEHKIPFSDRKIVESFQKDQPIDLQSLLVPQNDSQDRENNNKKRAWIEIDLQKLEHNFQLFLQDKPQELNYFLVVKDNALGIGSIEMAKIGIKFGAQYLCVACLSEALELRNAQIDFPILIFGERFENELLACIENNLTIQIQTFEQAEKISQIGKKIGKFVKIHLKVDTGMGRYGIHWKKAYDLYCKLLQISHLEIEGIFSHLARSDELDKDYAYLQYERFQTVIDQISCHSTLPKYIHLCNSGGYLDLPKLHYNTIRAGVLFTGAYPSAVCRRIKDRDQNTMLPVMSVYTKIAFIRELNQGDSVGYGMHFTAKEKMKIAVLPMGYGDGYPRLRNKGFVIIKEQKAPLIGGNAMDAMMIDVSHIQDVQTNDIVILLGKSTKHQITAYDLAQWSGSVIYDILIRWTKRMEKIIIPS